MCVILLGVVCRHHTVHLPGHGEGGVDRTDEPHGAANAADLPRSARRVRCAADLPLRLRGPIDGVAAARCVP